MEHFPEAMTQNSPAKHPPAQAGFKRGKPMSLFRVRYIRDSADMNELGKTAGLKKGDIQCLIKK